MHKAKGSKNDILSLYHTREFDVYLRDLVRNAHSIASFHLGSINMVDFPLDFDIAELVLAECFKPTISKCNYLMLGTYLIEGGRAITMVTPQEPDKHCIFSRYVRMHHKNIELIPICDLETYIFDYFNQKG